MAAWVETFKGAVLVSEYDANAQMNSRMYVSRFDQATWFLLHSVGVTPATMASLHRRIAIVRQNYQFLEELRGGELVIIRSGFTTVGERHLRFIHQMFNYETDMMLATSDCTAIEICLETGRRVALHETLSDAASQLVVTADCTEEEVASDGG